MTSQAYGIVALLMRYIFLLLGALIAARAFIWLWREHAAYMKQLRKDPDFGQIGELTDGKKSWPIYQEGTLGASRACDVAVRKKGLRRRHAGYRLQPRKGLVFTPAEDLVQAVHVNLPEETRVTVRFASGEVTSRLRFGWIYRDGRVSDEPLPALC